MTHVTCRLTAKTRDHLRNPMLGNRVWATITFFMELHGVTFGDSTPKATLRLNNDTLGWSSSVKCLGLCLTSGANFKIDLNTAKRKWCFFYNIKSEIGQQVNEVMVLKLVKTKGYWAR